MKEWYATRHCAVDTATPEYNVAGKDKMVMLADAEAEIGKVRKEGWDAAWGMRFEEVLAKARADERERIIQWLISHHWHGVAWELTHEPKPIGKINEQAWSGDLFRDMIIKAVNEITDAVNELRARQK